MKTLRELEKERLRKEKSKLSDLSDSYNKKDISESTKHEITKRIKNAKKAISNLSDIVKQEIARNANLLFYGIKEALTTDEFRRLYYCDFEEFIEKIASLEETINGYERISKNAYNIDIQRAILYFGFTKKELETLIQDGIIDSSREVFMSFINKRYKIQIPPTKEFTMKKQTEEKDNIVDRTKNNYEYKKMKLHNGDYMKGEYPECYEFDLDTYYKELIKKSKEIHKRTRKK